MDGRVGFKNNWNAHLGGTLNGLRAMYCDRCTRGGPTLRTSRGFFPWGGINTDSRKVVSGGAFLNLSYTDEGNSTGQSWSPDVNLRFSTRMQFNVGGGYSTNSNDAQWFANFTDGTGTTHYSFAHLDQRTVSMNVRLNYTVTPEFTLEYYGQPFTASGEYTNVREVSATPHADGARPPVPVAAASVVVAGLSRPVRSTSEQYVPGEGGILAEQIERTARSES